MDKKEILKKFEELKEQAVYIMNLISDKSIKKSSKKAEIHEKSKILKETLKSEYNRLQLNKVQNELNFYESAFYSPGITDAFIHFSARYNTNNFEELFNSLYDVEDYMNYWSWKIKECTEIV